MMYGIGSYLEAFLKEKLNIYFCLLRFGTEVYGT